jgi:hypothetical protein
VQLFYSFFKKMVGKEVAVELKNDVELTGKLHSVRVPGCSILNAHPFSQQL